MARCLIENFPPERGVEYCHVVARKTWKNKQLLDSLEWHWGMRSNTLNLDTRQNVFPAGASLHRMFDAGQYILVPAEDIVQRYLGALRGDPLRANRKSFPLIEDRDNTFEYCLIPLKNMEKIALSRQNDSIPLAHDAFTTHLYPFTTLSPLVSRIHPKFVIVSGGYRLHSMPTDEFEALTQTFPILTTILKLYLSWSVPVPGAAKSDLTYWPPYPEDDDEGNGGDDPNDKDYDVFTEKGRGSGPYRKRPRQLSPTPNRAGNSKTMGAYHDPVDSDDPSPAFKRKESSNLSRGSVIEHTRKMGKIGWDQDALINWSSNCQPLGPADPPVST